MFQEPTTIRDALMAAAARLREAGINGARLDAQLLLAWVIKGRREDLARAPERVLTERERLILNKAVSLRARRRPLAYITGEQWFYGRPFKINRAVLIPRPETELLVDFVLEKARDKDSSTVADIGTGSGCIAVSVACELPPASVFAVDLSPLALLVARKNCVRYGVAERVTLLEGDLLAPLAEKSLDIIVSNPPYVRPDEAASLMPEVRDYEPSLALYEGAGEDGMHLHRRLISEGRAVLIQCGWLAMEVGLGQAEEVGRCFKENGYNQVSVMRDDAGIDRVVAGRWGENK